MQFYVGSFIDKADENMSESSHFSSADIVAYQFSPQIVGHCSFNEFLTINNG